MNSYSNAAMFYQAIKIIASLKIVVDDKLQPAEINDICRNK